MPYFPKVHLCKAAAAGGLYYVNQAECGRRNKGQTFPLIKMPKAFRKHQQYDPETTCTRCLKKSINP